MFSLLYAPKLLGALPFQAVFVLSKSVVCEVTVLWSLSSFWDWENRIFPWEYTHTGHSLGLFSHFLKGCGHHSHCVQRGNWEWENVGNLSAVMEGVGDRIQYEYSLLAPNPRKFCLFMLSSGEDEFQLCHHCAHFELSFVMKGVVACHDLVGKR